MSHTERKVALVTGASRGIALKLAGDGFRVVVNYAGNQALADEVVAEIQRQRGEALAVQADVGEAGAVSRLFEHVLGAWGRLDAVVHNAGSMEMAPITSDGVEALDRMLSTNLRGSWLVMAKAAETLGEGGRIVALSSSVLAKSFPGYGAYIASKAGVEGLVKVLANELRGRQVTVNGVAPGPVATELFLEGKSDEQVKSLANLSPLERLGEPEDIADVVAFLVGHGGWVNGQVLRANGGFA